MHTRHITTWCSHSLAQQQPSKFWGCFLTQPRTALLVATVHFSASIHLFLACSEMGLTCSVSYWTSAGFGFLSSWDTFEDFTQNNQKPLTREGNWAVVLLTSAIPKLLAPWAEWVAWDQATEGSLCGIGAWGPSSGVILHASLTPRIQMWPQILTHMLGQGHVIQPSGNMGAAINASAAPLLPHFQTPKELRYPDDMAALIRSGSGVRDWAPLA